MTRPVGYFLLLTSLLLATTDGVRSQPRTLNSAALVRAQVYLDSLWAIYDVVVDSTPSAQTRMRWLLDEWEENRTPSAVPAGSAAQVCREVYSDVFRSRYYSNVRTEEKRGLVSTVKTPYLLIPDSVRYLVIADSSTWATLSGRSGDHRARNSLLYSHPDTRRFHPDLEMPARIIHIDQTQYEALNCFINGEKAATEYSRQRSPTTDRFDWLCRFFPICFSHGGDRYPLYAHPVIGFIALNHDMTEAVVTITLWCYFGEKRLCRKVDGVWKSIKSFDGWEI
ncbi:MAG: hypothetical protein IH600_17480 [Bacteroidetes bacterium]|nr:hypothetical protein [Bacteroidota bacterium]